MSTILNLLTKIHKKCLLCIIEDFNNLNFLFIYAKYLSSIKIKSSRDSGLHIFNKCKLEKNYKMLNILKIIYSTKLVADKKVNFYKTGQICLV